MCSKKDINFKVFNLISNKNEAKAIAKYISCDCKWKFNSKTCNSNQKWNNKRFQCDCKNYHKSKKDYNWNLSTCTCENRKYLRNIADNSVIPCDEIVHVMDILLTKMANTIGRSTVSINSDGKKVKYKIDWFILDTVLSVIILLLIITIICYHYAKHRSKQKDFDALAI